MGNRFRMIVNEIEVTQPEQDLPKLPVARAVWLVTSEKRPIRGLDSGSWRNSLVEEIL
jgi:L-arabinose isomerase